MKTKNDLKPAVTLLGSLSLLSIIGISFMTWRFCDDFRFEKVLQTKGVFEYMYYLYLTFDGRFLSLSAFIQLAVFKYLNINFIVFIWSLFFIANSILILKIIFDDFGYLMKLIPKEIIYSISIISVTLFYGFYLHISETVFWAVGGVYMLNVFLGLLWIIFYRNVIKGSPHFHIILFYSIFSIVVGMLTQNLVICLFAFLFVEAIQFFYNREKNKILLLCLFGICLFAGLIITSFSPGTLHRISLYPNSFDTNPLNYFKYFYNISKVFLRTSIVLIPISIISAVVIFNNLNIIYTPKVNQTNNKGVTFLIELKWLIISASSILPFLLVPNTVCYRTSLFFMIFIFIFIFVTVFKFLSQLKNTGLSKYKKGINIFLTVVFICHLAYISYCYKIGHDYQEYMSNTDKYLMTQRNSSKEIVIKTKTLLYKPFMFNLEEWILTDNPENWINKEWSFYYEIERIKAE